MSTTKTKRVRPRVLVAKPAAVLAKSPKSIRDCLTSSKDLTQDRFTELYEGLYSPERTHSEVIKEFLSTGVAEFRCGDFAIIDLGSSCVLAISPDGEMFYPELFHKVGSFKRGLRNTPRDVEGVILFRKGEILLVNNGDGETAEPVEGFPTLSFRCLGRFFTSNEKELTRAGIEALARGKLLDYSVDTRIKLTAAEKKLLHNDEHKLVKPGFSLLDLDDDSTVWHRSATCLVSYKGSTILLGVDEGTYFGCELRDKVETIEQAFESLVPKPIRGKNCPRQGEWFAERIDDKKAPKITDAIAIGGVDNEDNWADLSVALPVEGPDSSLHVVNGDNVYITKNGIEALNPLISHRDHRDLELKGWYRFHRNTAIRSFSEEGVD